MRTWVNKKNSLSPLSDKSLIFTVGKSLFSLASRRLHRKLVSRRILAAVFRCRLRRCFFGSYLCLLCAVVVVVVVVVFSVHHYAGNLRLFHAPCCCEMAHVSQKLLFLLCSSRPLPCNFYPLFFFSVSTATFFGHGPLSCLHACAPHPLSYYLHHQPSTATI